MDWIKVEDRLPEDDKYRFILSDKGIGMAYCSVNKKGWVDRDGWYIDEEVTHWAEIEPPKD